MASQQGLILEPNAERPPLSFVRDDTCDEVMFCVSSSIKEEPLRGIAQRFCDIDNRAVDVVYCASLNQYRIFHPNTPLANQLEGYDFLYSVLPKAIPSSDLDAVSTDADDANNANDAKHVPRPRNKWILYRQEKSREILGTKPNLSAGEISKIAAEMWKNESEEVKAYWTEKAKEEEHQHKEKYPEYQSSANKAKKTPKKRKASVSHSFSPPHKNAKHAMSEL